MGNASSSGGATQEQTSAPTPSPSSTSNLPNGVEASLPLFTKQQQVLVKLLCSPILNQSQLFASWSDPSTTNDCKKQLVTQLDDLNSSYPGGLAGYISNARKLLEQSKQGVNPLEGWKPNVPTGQAFEIGTKDYNTVEALGVQELGSVGFVLVAGGLGERLGYSDIKIGLPTEMATETKYIQYYIEYILALQRKYAAQGTKLPLCIMTSGDTNDKTVQLLQANNYFGMEKSQITLVQQGQGVPALTDNDATIAMDGPCAVSTKPHGHGDVHSLLYSHGVAKKWVKNGIGWIAFFQDTNGLAFHTLPLALGVSKKFDLVMNSLTVPRKAKQAIGGIAKLVNDKGEERTINVEYNMLDPLLRATGHPDGDVNDKETGFSPFPGNINQLLFKAKPYSETLERTKGKMPEFVNPKYKDEAKTVFKKPTRLECMMQDFPTVLEGKDTERVGFTSVPASLCFSPVKNATSDGAALQKKGSPAGVAATGEADQYCAVREILRSIGCNVADAEPATYKDITIVPGPQIVLKPDFVCCPAEYKKAFPTPEKVNISANSSLVVKGSGVVIESLDLDGALVIECEEGAKGVIRNLTVTNAGWMLSPVVTSEDEIIAMRGYIIDKRETKRIVFKKNGSIEGDYDPNATTISAPTATPANGKSASRSVPELNQPASNETSQKQKEDECTCTIL